MTAVDDFNKTLDQLAKSFEKMPFKGKVEKRKVKGSYSRDDDQRPGQALINYVRFVKGVKSEHFKNHSIVSHAVENYIWNMENKEFLEALNFDWEKDRDKVKKEFKVT